MSASGQANFTAALFDAALPAPANLMNPSGDYAPKRFNVYRNNVIVSLSEAMKDGFPLVERIVGTEFFEAMARTYVGQYPPSSPLMFLYGENFPAFIESFEPANSVPYLADIARLEYLKRLAYFAADADYVDPRETSLETLITAPLILHPSVYCIASPFPIVSIFERLQNGDGEVKPGAEEALVYRRRSIVEVERAPQGFTEFTSGLTGQEFETAILNFQSKNPETPLEPLIPLAIQLSLRTA